VKTYSSRSQGYTAILAPSTIAFHRLSSSTHPSIHPSHTRAACLVQRLTSALADKRIRSSKKHSHLSISKGNLSAGHLSCVYTLQQRQSRDSIYELSLLAHAFPLFLVSPGQQGGGGVGIERKWNEEARRIATRLHTVNGRGP